MDGFCTFITFNDGELGDVYDGPVHSFELPKPEPKIATELNQQITPEKEKCDPKLGKDKTPEVSKSAKVSKTPSSAAPAVATPESMGMKPIKDFFKIKPRRVVPTLVTSRNNDESNTSPQIVKTIATATPTPQPPPTASLKASESTDIDRSSTTNGKLDDEIIILD